MRKYLISVLVLLVIMTSVQNVMAFNTSLNATTKMLEIRNDNGSINRTIFPVGMYGICDSYQNGSCDPSMNPEFDYNIGDFLYGNYDSYVSTLGVNGIGMQIRADNLPLPNLTTQNNPYIYGSMQYSDTCTDEPDYSVIGCRDISSTNWNVSKQYYPNKLVYMGNWRNIINWLTGNYTDIIGLSAYANLAYYHVTGAGSWCTAPDDCFSREELGYGQEILMSRVGNGIANYYWNNSIFANKAVWLIMDTRGLEGEDPAGYYTTTQTEARLLTYTGVAMGIQGIAYYGYYAYPDEGLSWNSTKRQWYGDIKTELTSLNDILIMPTRAYFNFIDQNISYMSITPNALKPSILWESVPRFTYILKQPNSSTAYLIAVNKDNTTSGEVTINISGFTGNQTVTYLGNAISGSGRSTLSDASHKTTAINGSFTDTFDEYTVHIYEVSNSSESPQIITSTYQTCVDGGSGTIRAGIFCDDFTDNNLNGWNITNITGNQNGTWDASSGKATLLGGNSPLSYIRQNITEHQNAEYRTTVVIENLSSYVDAIDFYVQSPLEMYQFSVGGGINRTYIIRCTGTVESCTILNETSTFPMTIGQPLYTVVRTLNPTGGQVNINAYISNISYDDALSRGVHVSASDSTYLSGKAVQVGGLVYGNTSFDDILIRGLNSNGSELSPYRPNPPTNLVGGCYQNYTCEWGWT